MPLNKLTVELDNLTELTLHALSGKQQWRITTEIPVLFVVRRAGWDGSPNEGEVVGEASTVYFSI